MRVLRTFVGFCLTLFVLTLCGCAGPSDTDTNLLKPADPAAPEWMQTGGSLDLPSPETLLDGMTEPRRVSAASLYCSGSEYLPELGQRVSVEGSSLRLAPAWIAPASGLADAAYAIFHCNLEDVADTNQLTCLWDTPPADYGDVWFGLSNWIGNRWDWHPAPTDNTLDLGSNGAEPFTEPGSSDMYIVVLLLGTSEAVLAELELNGVYAVTAQLTADPLTGLAPLTVEFDATLSTSPAGAIELYEWDWDGTGSGPWDEDSGATPTVTHEYTTPGVYTAWVQVTDGRGTTSAASVTINVTVPPGPGDWYMFGRDAQHSRRSPFTGPSTNTLKWSYDAADPLGSAAAFAVDGTIYIGGGDGLYALNPDGTLQWKFPTGASMTCPAVGYDGTIYVGSWTSEMFAINPDGTVRWSFPTGGGVGSPAVGSDGSIYIGCADNYLYAITPGGSEQWHFHAGGTMAWTCPAIGPDGTIYVTCWNDYLYAINPDGTEKWNFVADDDMGYGPAIGADGTIYVGSYDDNLYAINPDGSQQWKYSLWGDIDACPALGADGTIYVACGDGYLYEVHPNGTLGWKFGGYDMMWPSPAVGGDGTIYCGNWDNNLYALNPDGTLKWSYETGDDVDSSPAIGPDGTVYFGSNDGKLYAIGPGGV